MNLWIAKLSLILKLQYRFSSLDMISYSILHVYKTAWYKTNAKSYVKMDNWFAILPEPWPIFLLKYVLYTFYWLISYISLHILNPWIIVLGHIYTSRKSMISALNLAYLAVISRARISWSYRICVWYGPASWYIHWFLMGFLISAGWFIIKCIEIGVILVQINSGS